MGHRQEVKGTTTISQAPSSFNTKEGWVHMPEGAFPELIGFWMEVFGLAGPGSSQPTHDWGSSPQGDCVF